MDLPPVLAPLRDRPSESALFVDFDGTLAAIVEDPSEARPLPGASAVLARLASHFGLVAVVSGRPAGFLLQTLDRPLGVHVVGLYGMETCEPGGTVRVSEEARAWRPVVAEVAERAQANAPRRVGIELKGLTVTLHWRTRPDAQAWVSEFCASETSRTGLVGQPGRMAMELRPPVDVDKGSVVRTMGAGYTRLACFGDDLGDLPAFRVLGEMAANGASVARVAVVDQESPAEVAAMADLVVEGAPAAIRLLQRLAEAITSAFD
ncbi:MAG: trehalose-phosphatase [Actinomycetota bacterium]|jgi:trehalose 6-phosphate phosphatase|nr:trehalose-phosphatase [Actinomycetota bacterium]